MAPGDTPHATRLPPREAIVEALMRLAAEQPWNDIEIADIRPRGRREPGRVPRLPTPRRARCSAASPALIDKQVLEGASDDLDEEPTRERLFDV